MLFITLQMGTYFGAAVKGVDLNHDGLTDLLVGAPLFSDVEDEGRVYIYINDGNVSSYGQRLDTYTIWLQLHDYLATARSLSGHS